MNRISLSLMVIVALVATQVKAELSQIDALRAKLRGRFGQVSSYAASNAYAGGYNDGEATAASSAVGGQFGGSSAAAAASAGGYRHYQPAYNAPAPVAPAPVAPAPAPVPQVQPVYYGSGASAYAGQGGRAGAAAAVRAAPAYVQGPSSAPAAAPAPPAAPARPAVSIEQFAAPVRGRFGARRSRYGGYGGYRAAAAAAAGTGVGAGAGAASAVGVAGVNGVHGVSGVHGAAAATSSASGSNEGYSGVAAAATGTLANNGVQHEASAYKRSTENVENHEDGKVDDNHYYNAQSYGKAEDENMHEAFSKNDEDVEATPTVYRSKKSGENYVMDYNKARRESGSGVLAKDKHSSAFSKNSKRFNENVDQSHQSDRNGIVEDTNQVSAQAFADEDEEIYDSDGFAAPVAPKVALAASSAVGGGQRGGAVATSAALARA